MTRNVFFSILISGHGVAVGAIIHIPADFPTIQQGIDAAENGDTVFVSPGVYVESLLVENKNLLLASEQGPLNTSIQGNLVFSDSVDSSSTLRGFTVVGYDENESPLLSCLYASPLIEGNIITLCCPHRFGQAIYLFHSNSIIRDNMIQNNRSVHDGGGILTEFSDVVIRGNVITGNQAGVGSTDTGVGGGMCIWNSQAIVERNVICNNRAVHPQYHGGGGGIFVRLSTMIVLNNSICNNFAQETHYPWEGRGAGICISESEVSIRNSIFWGNVCSNNENNDIEGEAEVTYSDIADGHSGQGNISEYPIFADTQNLDYHLLESSPCIDAGDPDSPLDPDGTVADIGAYYFDQRVGIDDPGEASGPYRFRLHQNYPNPFNAQTVISYYLPDVAKVSLRIYSIAGNRVVSLVNREIQVAGEYEFVWDGTSENGTTVATGIYFYELQVDDHRESKAMIMIK